MKIINWLKNRWLFKQIKLALFRAVVFEDIKLSSQTKGLLTILIHEIQKCENMDEIDALSQSWVKANNLNPDEVITMSDEEFKRHIRGL